MFEFRVWVAGGAGVGSALGVEVEDLGEYLPGAVDFDEGPVVGEAVAAPVVDLETEGGGGAGDVEGGEADFDGGGGGILVDEVVEDLNGAGDEVGAEVAGDGGEGVEGGLDEVGFAGTGAVDIVLNNGGNGIVFVDSGGGRHWRSVSEYLHLPNRLDLQPARTCENQIKQGRHCGKFNTGGKSREDLPRR